MKSNFEFLNRYWPALSEIGAALENYLYSDPNACIYSISIKAGAELSYLNVPSQSMVNDLIEKELCTVSKSQAKQIKELLL